MNPMLEYDVILFGGGPANLMTASCLMDSGLRVALFEQNSQIGKKFLLAGKSGLNLSMDFTFDRFVNQYYRDSEFISIALKLFTPQQQRDYFDKTLGISTYVGSAGKVFPEVSAVQFLKIWLSHLKDKGLQIFTHHQWLSGDQNKHQVYNIKTKTHIKVTSHISVFGFGGNSWRETGSNANWVIPFRNCGVEVNLFQPSNSGVKCELDEYIFNKWNGTFIKNIVLKYEDLQFTGEIRIGDHQLEGSPIYHLNHHIREALKKGNVRVYIDFKPQWSQLELEQKWNSKFSLSKNIKQLKIVNIYPSLFKSLNSNSHPLESIKNFPIVITGYEELDKAISTIGGVSLNEVNSSLNLLKQPNWFINGEMLDWDAPTGGYLLSGCFALGKTIASQIIRASKLKS